MLLILILIPTEPNLGEVRKRSIVVVVVIKTTHDLLELQTGHRNGLFCPGVREGRPQSAGDRYGP